MAKGDGFLSNISWVQVIASALAAMTAAWFASNLGVGGTIIGAAMGSFAITFSSAFYSHTLHRGRTLLVQTDRGRVIEEQIQDGDVHEALADATKDAKGEIVGAKLAERDTAPIRWKALIVTSLIVLVVAMAGITAYELASGKPIGGNHSGGTTLSQVVQGGDRKPATPAPNDPAAPEGSPSAPTEAPTTAQPTANPPVPSAPANATPAPPDDAPAPTPSGP